jgi:hypothetical protein
MADSQVEFIRRAAPGARRAFKDFGVPASVTIAQAILESGWGKSHLGSANNYFGIKAESPASVGPIAVGAVTVPTREVINGRPITVNGRFLKYRSIDDSLRDHGRFLRENARYQPAFAHTTNADAFARAIHKAGYATDPQYATKLIALMKEWNLYRFDRAPAEVRAGRYIARLQRDLNRHLATREITVDGKWGPETERAFEAICRRLGIESTRTIRTFRQIASAGRARPAGAAKPKPKAKPMMRPAPRHQASGGGLAGDGDTEY